MPCKGPSWVKVGENHQPCCAAQEPSVEISVYRASRSFKKVLLSDAGVRRHVWPGQSDNESSGLLACLFPGGFSNCDYTSLLPGLPPA